MRHSSEPRKPRFGLPLSGSSDEDPYSLTPSGSSGSSGKGHRSGGGSGGENGSGQRSSDMSSGQENNGHRFHSREREYYGPQNWAKVSFGDCVHSSLEIPLKYPDEGQSYPRLRDLACGMRRHIHAT